MRIQHNIMALNASNRLKSNDNAISKNIAKLSSGYRINSAADDAAGLAVSEKMRAQINGLNQAEDNAQNGVSLIQTAEGGLNETEAILQRMNTLAVESANGTYQDGTDRANLNKEVTALKSEIDRISTSTNFNQINLLDGSLGGKAVTESVAAFSGMPTGAVGSVVTAAAENDSVTNTLTASANDVVSYTVDYVDADGKTQSVNVSYTAAGTQDAGAVATSVANALGKTDVGNLFDISADASTGKISFEAKTAGASEGKVTNIASSVNVNSPVTVTVGTAGADPDTAEVDSLVNSVVLKAGEQVTYNIKYQESATGDVKTASFTYTASVDESADAVAAAVAAGFNATLSSDFGVAVDTTTNNQINFTAKTAGAGKQKLLSATVSHTQNSSAAVSTESADAYQAIDTSKFNVSVADQNSFSVNGQKFAFVNLGGDPTTLASDVAYVVVTGANTITADDAAAMANLVQQKTGMVASNITPGTTTTTTNVYVSGKVQKTSTDGVTFQIGSENKADQTVSLSINDMSSSGLGVSNVSIKNQGDAKVAIDTIKSAINTVSATRANLGALQNRLEHTENNLSTMSQNLTSAESNIRDVDMSDEYVQYSKNQILSQAATAMLTQANAQPQNVLSLLKG